MTIKILIRRTSFAGSIVLIKYMGLLCLFVVEFGCGGTGRRIDLGEFVPSGVSCIKTTEQSIRGEFVLLDVVSWPFDKLVLTFMTQDSVGYFVITDQYSKDQLHQLDEKYISLERHKHYYLLLNAYETPPALRSTLELSLRGSDSLYMTDNLKNPMTLFYGDGKIQTKVYKCPDIYGIYLRVKE